MASGRTNSRVILKEAGIDPQRRAKELTEDELAKIIGIIDKAFAGRRRLAPADPAEHRPAARHRQLPRQPPSPQRCPVRGQRTRSNARTRKGPRKTVAGKKGVKELGK